MKSTAAPSSKRFWLKCSQEGPASRRPIRRHPVVVAPVRDGKGNAITAIGIVDVTGIFDLANFMEQSADPEAGVWQ